MASGSFHLKQAIIHPEAARFNVNSAIEQLEDSVKPLFHSTVHLFQSSLNHFGGNFRKKLASLSGFA
ncbi:hypothetical protein NC99_10760 [Sunxiuqinia dokdonensis]|uniref:Uncharacterized protein n=1 Tax=Sunxiuqinia dokdonensis TaxID=1409788 RepID=A0A0L8VD55_9BACT|nr:hypothetical protein NC99_10760 [Sunxiuqinia dokdonensis]